MKGKRIRNLTELIRAAEEKRSVIMAQCSCGLCVQTGLAHILPAAFVLGMPAIRVDAELKYGLYIYKPKHSKRPIRIKK